jgi:hypothetical protein
MTPGETLAAQARALHARLHERWERTWEALDLEGRCRLAHLVALTRIRYERRHSAAKAEMERWSAEFGEGK